MQIYTGQARCTRVYSWPQKRTVTWGMGQMTNMHGKFEIPRGYTVAPALDLRNAMLQRIDAVHVTHYSSQSDGSPSFQHETIT
jgi:hypothetical protein